MRPLFLFPAPGRILRESRKFFQGAGFIISVMSPAGAGCGRTRLCRYFRKGTDFPEDYVFREIP